MTPTKEKQLHEALVLACPELKIPKEYRIDGSPVQASPALSHVLRALSDKSGYYFSGVADGCLVFESGMEGGAETRFKYFNLTKDSLSEQSEEFKLWLHSLICERV